MYYESPVDEKEQMTMKRFWLLVTLGLLACAAPSAWATHSALAAQEVVGTTADGAQYAFFIPSSWNGNLVVYAHGYVDPAAPVLPPDVSPAIAALREALLGFGYAVAYSSYSMNGYAIKEGGQRTHQLRGLFASRFGQPSRTYVMGHSLGGIITVMLAEKYPNQYAGALAMCGPLGGGALEIDYIGNVRVLFDFFFPGVIPGDALHVPLGLDYTGVVVPVIVGALLANPAAAVAMASVDQIELPYTNFFELMTSVVRALSYNVLGTNDLLTRTHGHSPFDNTNTFYTGLGPVDAVLNAGIDRFASSIDALNYLEQYYQPSGKLKIPVVTLHTTLDPEVPFFHEAAFAAIAGGAGASNLLVQQHVIRYGHCEFNLTETANAFFGLVNWVEHGVQPTGGNVTAP
jgi:pimeloyl-ACP methyl ester carboxylesterase